MQQYDTVKARFEPVDRGPRLKPQARIRIGTVAEFTAVLLQDDGNWQMQAHDPIWDGSGIGWVLLSDLKIIDENKRLAVNSDQFFAKLDDTLAFNEALKVKRYKDFIAPPKAFQTYEDLQTYVNTHQSLRLWDSRDVETNPNPFTLKRDVPETVCLVYAVVDGFYFESPEPKKMIWEYQIPVLENLCSRLENDPERHLNKHYFFPVWFRRWVGVWGGKMGQSKKWECYPADIRCYGLVQKGMTSDGAIFAEKADAQAYVESWVPMKG